jgi:membrane-associated phospholipid phosphatase|tara:strand:+ start:1723 stop:2892 length:1170 start_codon:yes stop_codon:yes gene_type:complete
MNLSSVNKNFLSNITIEKGYVFTFLVIVFSVDFHFLWLLYDFLALFALYFFSKHVNVVLGSTLVLVLSFFIIVTIISGFHIISVLSIWDNIKHVFVLFMLLFLVERHIEGRILKFANSFGFIIGSIFIIQSTLVFYQSFNGYFKDDISGTFGMASGHTFAYYCLLYLSYLFYVKRSYLLTLCVFVLSLVMNYLAENMGYYPLVLLLLSYNWWTLKGLKSMIFYGIALLLGIMIIDNILGGVLIQPVLYRFSEFFLVGSIDLDNLNQSRGYMTALALYLGGWWGSGPGCYSEIYSITGWEYLAGIQLNISSVTNLLAEYGAVGVLLWLFLYFSFIKRFFKKRKDFIFIFMLFTSSLLYNKVLNDERVIFLLIFLFMFIKIYIDRKVLKND